MPPTDRRRRPWNDRRTTHRESCFFNDFTWNRYVSGRHGTCRARASRAVVISCNPETVKVKSETLMKTSTRMAAALAFVLGLAGLTRVHGQAPAANDAFDDAHF